MHGRVRVCMCVCERVYERARVCMSVYMSVCVCKMVFVSSPAASVVARVELAGTAQHHISID